MLAILSVAWIIGHWLESAKDFCEIIVPSVYDGFFFFLMLLNKEERKTLCEGQKQTRGQGQISKIPFRQAQIQIYTIERRGWKTQGES